MKQIVAATGAQRVTRSNRDLPMPTWRKRFMKPTWAGYFSSDGLHWPPVEISRRSRTRIVARTLPKCRLLKPHAVLGVIVATGPRGSTGLPLRRPVPLPLSRVLTSHLLGVMEALGIGTPAVDTPLGTQITKIQSSDCSLQWKRSEVLNVTGATTQLLQQSVKLHPVLGVFVPTRRRSSRCPCPCQCSRVLELVSLFPGGNCENMPVGTPQGTQITKTQSSDSSALVAVDSTSSVTQGSEVINVTGATTQLLQQRVKLHPVLGVFVPTRRRSSRCR